MPVSGALHDLKSGLSQMGKAGGHGDASLFKGLDLIFGFALATGYNGARMAHAFPGRRRLPRNEGDHGLAKGGLYICGGFFFGGSADLSDQYHPFGVRVFLKPFEMVNKGAADDRVPADADAGGLAQSHLG